MPRTPEGFETKPSKNPQVSQSSNGVTLQALHLLDRTSTSSKIPPMLQGGPLNATQVLLLPKLVDSKGWVSRKCP